MTEPKDKKPGMGGVNSSARKTQECPVCKGAGEWMHWVRGEMFPCAKCKGSGRVPKPTPSRGDGPHDKGCRWERTTEQECEYRATHHYCPHPEHACDCSLSKPRGDGELPLNQVVCGEASEVLSSFPAESVDLVVTSPPYDNLRDYESSFDFDELAVQLYRVTKPGGVVVWVVGDQTVKGSETGTSFKQALGFKEVGFNLHDTMIWEKTGRLPTQDRYYNVFEFMFVFSKGKPKAMNFICDHETTSGGRVQQKDAVINKGKNQKGQGTFVRNKFARRGNIWKIHIGRNTTGHPAIFPEQLASDHIKTWSNEGDLVLDPFNGSGTTTKMANQLGRSYLGIDISEDYCEIARKRLKPTLL